jgi:hypothetical protein
MKIQFKMILAYSLLSASCGLTTEKTADSSNAQIVKTNKEMLIGYWLTHEPKATMSFDFKASQDVEMRYVMNDGSFDTTIQGAYYFKNNMQVLITDFGGKMHDEDSIVSMTDSTMILQKSDETKQAIYRKMAAK